MGCRQKPAGRRIDSKQSPGNFPVDGGILLENCRFFGSNGPNRTRRSLCRHDLSINPLHTLAGKISQSTANLDTRSGSFPRFAQGGSARFSQRHSSTSYLKGLPNLRLHGLKRGRHGAHAVLAGPRRWRVVDPWTTGPRAYSRFRGRRSSTFPARSRRRTPPRFGV